MRKNKIRKRIIAAVMAVCLILTGGWTGTPVDAYASPVIREAETVWQMQSETVRTPETQSGEQDDTEKTAEENQTTQENQLAQTTPDQQSAGESASKGAENTGDTEQNLSAMLGGIRKYFTSLKGTALGNSPAILPGISLPEKTTSLTFPAADGYYYLVVRSDSGVAVTPPASHEAALNAGWIKKIGGDESFVWTGLEWNTSYHVYETDLSTVTLLGEHIVTNKGQAGGTVLIAGDLLTGGSVTASLDDSAPTTGGTWSWYYGNTTDGWTGILLDQPGGAFQIPGPETVGGQYLKAVFTAAGDYEGSVEFISSSRLASRLTGVQITGTAKIGGTLEAAAEPSACEPGVQYSWYRQSGESSQPETDTLVYTGKSYTVQADDIGKKLYVTAASLENSVSNGTAVSASTETVESSMAGPVGVPENTNMTDTSVTVKMPDGSQGLYQFAWSTTPGWNPDSDSFTVFETKTRDAVPVTIPELNPSTAYEIRARQIGENGWLDSDWGAALSVHTLALALRGGLTLSGSCIYGESLTAALESPGQAGSFHWYRVSQTAGAVETEIPEAFGQSTYTLKAEDIGCQLRAIFQADGITNSGEISVLSDIVEKAEQAYPVAADLGSITSTDSSLSFAMPPGINHVLVGYSEVEHGVPESVASGRIYNEGDTVGLTDLERDTVYYLFLKYAQTETHRESNWSPAADSQSTEKTVLTGSTIAFTPAVLAPGNVLTAELTNFPEGDVEGTWTWTENIPEGGSIQTSFRQDVDQPYQTSCIIPSDKADGTTYTVTFTGEGGLTGTVSNTSPQVKAAEKTPYPTPGAPALVTAGDTSLTVAMEGVTDGIYSFSYSQDAAAPEGSRTAVKGRYYGGGSAVITGLDRNRTYYIWAQQNASGDHKDSEWGQVSSGYLTAKTYIGGTVKLTGESRYGDTLTAAYTGASYMPEGDDSGGSFRWYRGTVPADLSFRINGAQPVAAEPVYSLIAGENAVSYTVRPEDIGCYIKAEYRGIGDFQGTREAVSQIIGKAAQTNPSAGVLSADQPEASAVVMKLQLTAGSYYQVRKSTDVIPEAPESAAAALTSGWILAAGAEETITACYTTGGGETLKPNTEYTVYTVTPGTGLNQPSQVVKGNTAGSTQYLQTGTLLYHSIQDETGDQILSGGELEVKLQGANSLKGTWKWYVSDQDYSAVAGGTKPDWTQLVSGYLPTVNSESSRLTLTDEMLGHYIRAEFVADSQAGYSGTVDADTEGNRYYKTYVKKIYKETLTLESSTSDGYGDPAAYANTVITVTVNDYAESGPITANRAAIKLNIGGTDMALTAVQDVSKDNQFRFTLPDTVTDWDQKKITGEVSVPRNPLLYLDENKQPLTKTSISSVTDSDTGIPYKYGIPVSTETDLVNFMNRAGNYTDWNGKTYVLTDNIKYPEGVAAAGNDNYFSGILDGDYHKISGLKDALFRNVGNVTIKNLIINQIRVDKPYSGSGNPGDIGAGAAVALRSYGTLVMNRVFLSQAYVSSAQDTGYFVGKLVSGSANVSECVAAGGYLDTKQAGNRVVGGILGYLNGKLTTMNNVMIMKTVMQGPEAGIGGVAVGEAYNGPRSVNITNALVAAQFQESPTGTYHQEWSGGVAAGINGPICNVKSSFYDSTLSPDPNLYQINGVDRSEYKGTPKPTKELIGTGVKSSFDANISGGSESLWTYDDGFYPRLNWVADDPICSLFAATRGAFTSVDGSTLSDDMFNGNISGSIEIPRDLQREGYSFSAEGSLTVDQSGLVTPTGQGSGKVIVSYADDLSSAENTYEFTVTSSTDQKKHFQSVTITNGREAKIGAILQAQTVFASSDAAPPAEASITYHWYRRKNGTTEKELIPEATGSTYEVQPKDAGHTIMVKAEASGYWEMGSSYSVLIEMSAPSMAPDVTPVDYQTVGITGRGGAVPRYEFAYAKTGGGKVLVPEDSAKPVTREITGLEANTSYEFYSRIPADMEGSYAASDWSPAAVAVTDLIPLDGQLTLSGTANVNETVIAQMPDTNLQKGTWSAEVVKNGVGSSVTDSSYFHHSDYQADYKIQPQDVGGVVKFTFTASAPYGGEARTAKTAEIGAAIQMAPLAPVLSEVTDSRIYLAVYNDDSDNTRYEYGLKGPSDSNIRLLTAADAALIDGRIAIQNLSRNTAYEIYARRKAVTGYQEGRWSPALAASTDRTEIGGLKPVFSTSGIQVEGTVTVTAPSVTGDIVTGEWKLERVDPENDAKRATLNDYSISADGAKITYDLTAADAGYLLCATLVGNGNFKGNAIVTTEAAVQKKQYPAPAASDYSIVSFNDSSVTVSVAAGKAGTFQFGYQTAEGAVIPYEGNVQQGSSFTISPLNRGTAYQICMKRLAETGYTESVWSPAQEVTLNKTEINGSIRIVGKLAVGVTIQASYESGNYAAPNDSDAGGTFTWTLTDEAGASTTHSGNAYEVKTEDPGRLVTVTYTPPSESKFTGNVKKQAGVVAKASVTAPGVPEAQAVADTGRGSTIKITNAEAGSWYKILPASESKPGLVMEPDGAAAGWRRADSAVLEITGLTANTDYIVYGVKLETEITAASTLTASARIRSGKEELGAEIGVSEPLKPMVDTRVTVSTYDQAPDGTWYWYASKERTADFKLIRSNRAVKESTAAADTFRIPYDYSGYYIKVVFQADGDFMGEKTWLSANAMENRQISGNVAVTPDEGSGRQRLFEQLTAAYGGTDDQHGTWKWYREGTDGSWTEIDSKLYQTAGITSSYTPGEADKGKALKAEYTAGSFGCTGSVSQTTAPIVPAEQNTPEPPEVLQTVGTGIQLSDSVPGQAKPYGERPAVTYGYRKVQGGTPQGEIQWNGSGAAWVRQLEPNTEYELYTRYEETNVYAQSAASRGTRQSIGSGALSQSGITLVYESDDDSRMDVGKRVKAVYSGEGYAGGTWTVSLSTGKVIAAEQYQTETSTEREETSCVYVIDIGAISSSLLFTYTADGINYSGSVSVKTDRTVRKPVSATPDKPAVSVHGDTDFYLDGVVNTQEYALTETPEAPGRYSGLWKVLTEVDSGGRYIYTSLKRNTTYYVHTRVAETDLQEVSETATSDPVTTLAYIGLGTLELTNRQDILAQPKAEVTLAMPETLELNGSLTLDKVTLKQVGTDGYEPAQVLEPYASFVTDDGGVSPNVFEKGSSWANDHYGTVLEVLNGSGQVIGSNRENPGVLTWAGEAAQVRASLYRANAVTRGGTYIWEILLKDSAENTALLHGEVKIITQLEATMPIQIALYIKDQELLQTTNGAGLKNGNGMPVEISVDEKPEAEPGVPPLLGEPAVRDPELMDSGAVYLELSVDNSLETGQVTDLWLNTTLPEASIKPLVKLGASSQADYYIRGLISKNGVNWQFPGENQTINAYKLKFIYEISKDEYPVYTPKISGPASETDAGMESSLESGSGAVPESGQVSQEGGES